MTTSPLAQPLEPGIHTADGRHYLLDHGAIRVLTKEFQDGPMLKDEEVSALYQGAEGWGDSFLALTDKGLARVSTNTPKLALDDLVATGEGLKVEAWGDNFIAYLPEGSDLTVLSPTSQTKLKIPIAGPLTSIEVVDSNLALIRTDQGLAELKLDSVGGEASFRLPTLPFPAKEARLALGAGRALAWSPASDQLVELVGKDSTDSDLSSVRPVTLAEKPIYGVRVLEDGSIVAAGEKRLTHLQPGGAVRRFNRPGVISEELFAGWPIVFFDGNLMVFIGEEGRTRVLHYRPRQLSSDLLPLGKLHSLVLPQPGQRGQALLFWDISSEEPKLDDEGRQIFDLGTGKEMAPLKLTVTGHRILALQDGRWVPVSEEARAHLVGPVQRIGDRVVYATQTEPIHAPGQQLEVNARFPYQAVILHGRSMLDPKNVWSFDKPRGETVSKDRLPETDWPVLDKGKGPLLITSEGGSLLAIDPASGELQWSLSDLPTDESSPLMLSWPDGFGLVATKSTGRAFLLIDSKHGKLLDTATLNQFFFWDKWRHLLGVIIVCAALAYYIYAAGKRNLYIRRIAGLQALDEAVGRATEMGKPVLYVVGLADVDDIQTMASLSILSHVARKTAEYDTPIVTTTARAVAFSAAQEIVRDAFSVAGRPDAFSVESVRYISDDQFGYTAGVDGIMVREKPAANFYIGNFYAESLILAETGYATGSIQIAGTAQPSQVPFFVAACDYTLIGEELFAASAYLSRDPLQVGSLRGQDVGKAIVMLLLVVCSLLVSVGVDWTYISKWTGLNLP